MTIKSDLSMESGQPHTVSVDPALQEIVPKFLNNLERQVGELGDAVEGGDLKTMLRIAHTLKGVCGGYGFDDLGEMARVIDEKGKAENMDEVPEIIDQMKSYMEKMEIVYEEEG